MTRRAWTSALASVTVLAACSGGTSGGQGGAGTTAGDGATQASASPAQASPAQASTPQASTPQASPAQIAALSPTPTAAPSVTRTSAGPIASMNGAQVAKLAAEALRGAGSFTYAATYGAGAWTSRQDFQVEGDAASGTYVDQGLLITMIGAGSMSYEKCPAEFWTRQGISEKNAAFLTTQWVRQSGPADNRDFPTADSIGRELTSPEGTHLERQVTTARFADQPVFKISYDDGSFAYIASHGEPLPLFLSTRHGEGSTITLTDFGRVHAAAPPIAFMDAEMLATMN